MKELKLYMIEPIDSMFGYSKKEPFELLFSIQIGTGIPLALFGDGRQAYGVRHLHHRQRSRG